MNSYGKELLLDLAGCDPATFNRESIEAFFVQLCEEINMERCDLHWWDDLDTPEDEKETEPHLVGTSAVQFIKTSNIVIHTLPILKEAYINIFSCKDYSDPKAARMARSHFKGYTHKYTIVTRGDR